jgi:DNA-binding NarL/FixJ family response regulator
MLSLARSLQARMGANCATIMDQSTNSPDIAELFSKLSGREQQVITLVCNGLSDKEIADNLDVTEDALKIHLQAIYEKLGPRSTFELMITLADRRRRKA